MSPRLRRLANARLGRAFLNRALDALHAGRPELARDALRRGSESLSGGARGDPPRPSPLRSDGGPGARRPKAGRRGLLLVAGRRPI